MQCIIQPVRGGTVYNYSHSTYSVRNGYSEEWRDLTKFFPTLESAIIWHNENCESEYGLTVDIAKEENMTTSIVETFSRRVFKVEAIQVDDDNLDHIANWCGGKVSSTKSGAPFVEVPTGKAGTQTFSRAFPGCWVVTGRGGYFSSYSDKAFQRTFERG